MGTLKSQQSSRTFFETLFKKVIEEAPVWTSDREEMKPYNFQGSVNYAQTNFPDSIEVSDFLNNIKSYVDSHLTRDNFPAQAHISWFLGVLATSLSAKQQQGIILDQFLPELWDDAKKRGYSSKIGEFVNPAILDVLPEALKPDFARKCAEKIRTSQSDERFTMLAAHARFGAHLGDYCLEAPKTQILTKLIEDMGAQAFVAWICEDKKDDKKILTHLISLSHMLTYRLPEPLAREVISEIDRQIEFPNLSADFSSSLKGHNRMAPPWAAKRVLGHMLRLLPEEKTRQYSTAIFSDLGEDSVRLLTYDLSWMDGDRHTKFFMEALPTETAKELIKKFIDTAWSEEYTASVEDVSACEAFNYYINFATSIYALIPSNLTSFFRDYVAHKLETASEQDKENALLKSSLLARGLVAQKAPVRTREVDFYVVRSFDYSSLLPATAAHIKPTEQKSLGIITSGQFIGSLQDYWHVLNNKDHSAPRYRAPNRRELFPPERYKPLGETFLEAAETKKQTDLSLPSFIDVLRAREP